MVDESNLIIGPSGSVYIGGCKMIAGVLLALMCVGAVWIARMEE